MPRQILAPAILVSLLAMLLLTARSDRARAADECASGPVGTAPPGSHWYYRLDRATHAHCWYLGPLGMRVAPAGTRAVPSVVRLPIARPTFLSGESAYASADASADPAATTPQRKPREGETSPTFAMRWLGSSASAAALASAAVSDETASATEPVAAGKADRLSSISPIREGADHESMAARAARPFALMLAVLVAGLASIGSAKGAMFRRFTARRRRGSTPADALRRRRTDDKGRSFRTIQPQR
jgi:hypothetical protein